ncbi:Uu.00g061520.m01.CDS01 [Anthostomella pinea]|uniref:Uu.00g061520.m01.CDS01 n=1 Tax=Anthostomella pinea TaxID=933095 RepID=A0AAI8VSG5_9PEZI|nr:Uu.00g061520.m01.CDS01 [Anthostomella pinea]
MASVSSLDKDLRKMRLDKYTPGAANEARSWVEAVLGERLPSNDLLEGLKDGLALCKLINMAIGPPGIKFKKSAMPFVQMENISHFLRACQSPPLNLQEHDMFLTVDLYEQKDPAQVLQCLGAFSRAAHNINPSAFPTAIGSRPRGGGVLSPQSTGPATPRNRGMSNVSATSSVYGSRPGLAAAKTGDSGSGRWSSTKSPTGERVGSPGSVSSWSKRDHEGVTNPAWNIAQYGYMGGASQGNLGIAFGGRRQITSASPNVPNMAEKERRRKELTAEAERQKHQIEEEGRVRQSELEAQEERARLEEERRWEEETRRQRADEKRQAEDEKRRWEEEERQWKLTEEKRRKEEEEAEAKLAGERHRTQNQNDGRLQGQFLSQYQAEQNSRTQKTGDDDYSDRIKQLEKELELARQREQQYEEERQRRSQKREASKHRALSRTRPGMPAREPSRQDSWSRDEREVLRTSRDQHQETAPPPPPRPLPVPTAAPVKTNRTGEMAPVKPHRTGEGRPLPVPDRARNQVPSGFGTGSPRPLPIPSAKPNANRTDRYLASNPAPVQPPPQQTYSRELDATAERDEEDRRRAQFQTKTKAGGFAGKSLLEREMEMERQRQREWEESQKETAKAARTGDGVDGIGGGVGGRWDVGQWSGYTGGDSQNNGSSGIGAGRRQIVGPRPLPGRP